MDLTRINSKPIVKTNEKYSDKPVLTLLAKKEEAKKTIKLNQKAFEMMKVTDSCHNLILFEKYNVGNTTGDIKNDELIPVIGVVSDKIVKVDKNYKSYEISLSTRNVKSKEIYDFIIEYFGLNEKETNYILIKESSVKGAFAFEVIDELFNKGEEVLIEEDKSNLTNQQ